MRILRKILLWLVGIIVGLVALAYITGNDHLVRGVRFHCSHLLSLLLLLLLLLLVLLAVLCCYHWHV